MTPKQRKLIKILTDNYSTKNNTKTLKEMLQEAGYTEETSIQPSRIIESETIQAELQPFVKQLEIKRALVMKHLTEEKISKEKAKDLANMTDTLTKNIQLLSGGATDRTVLVMPSELLEKNNINETNSSTSSTENSSK